MPPTKKQGEAMNWKKQDLFVMSTETLTAPALAAFVKKTTGIDVRICFILYISAKLVSKGVGVSIKIPMADFPYIMFGIAAGLTLITAIIMKYAPMLVGQWRNPLVWFAGGLVRCRV
jgi:hypothetical protein